MINKNELRIWAKNIRKYLPIKDISVQLVNLIRKNEVYVNAKNIMLYYPTEYEVDLRELFNDDKNFYLPKVYGKNLLICPYSSKPDNTTDLKKSCYGIFEPCSSPVNPNILDLVIIPALMCDKEGYRLGYGGGFYDRFISKYGQNFKTICPISKELCTYNLPHDEYDKKIDIVIKTI